MALSTAMHRPESYLNLHCTGNENVSIHQQISEQALNLLNQYDYSIHNCSCKGSKTGLVLYPDEIDMRNIILLVCEKCYNYELENDTPHGQLEKWYFNIYKDSKSFLFKSRFLQNEDNSLDFYNTISNTNETFNIKERQLDNYEKEIIQRIVERKLNKRRL